MEKHNRLTNGQIETALSVLDNIKDLQSIVDAVDTNRDEYETTRDMLIYAVTLAYISGYRAKKKETS